MCIYAKGKPLEKTFLEVVFLGRKNFKLLEDFNYQFAKDLMIDRELIVKNIAKEYYDKTYYIVIPKGFNTDFGSIPQVFQSLISPIGSPTKAYVLHDYLLYCFEVGEISKRVICDKAFKVALKNEGVGMLRRNFMYLCVRAYSILKEWIKK